jgi:hypothetical protein
MFRELTSPEDLHIYRISGRVIFSSPADSYIYRRTYKCTSPLDSEKSLSRFSTNVRVRWTRNYFENLFNEILRALF